MPVVLSIAGSDPSGGAGIQADLKTFHQFGAYGEAVITLLTAQNTLGIHRVEFLPAEFILEQLRDVLDDIPPAAIKTGALGTAEAVHAIARAIETFLLVVDPVLMSAQGQPLGTASLVGAIRDELLPRCSLITPNILEAEVLTGMSIRGPEELRRAAECIRSYGAPAVLIKGGHCQGPATDVLLDSAGWHEFPAPRIQTSHTHGTGCTYAAAITAGLASDLSLIDSVKQAKQFIQAAIQTAPGLGRGGGPLNHHATAR